MHHRNVLPLVRHLVGACLGAAILTVTLPARADETAAAGNDAFPLISLLMPSLIMPSLADQAPTSREPMNNEPAAADPAASNGEEPSSGGLTTYDLRISQLPADNIDLTSNPDNLWDRIRNGFAMPDLNDDLTLYYQQWYQARPETLRRMVERARPYMHFIVQELETRGMPTELALLPMVESSFNPMAYSRSNAAGLWQFIPATGKRFNLEQNWWRDERRDIVASTSAALDYLQTIYEMHGDWQLALASYNWGEGAVKRAIEKNAARGLPTDYLSLNMPNETRHYVPKLQALKNIFGNPALMVQLHLPEILNQPYFTTIDTPRPMDVKTAARLANMPIDEFIALNPSHNRPVINADTPLVLPTDRLGIFRRNLEKNAAPLSQWQAYTLKRGERLKQLAPRFGISLPELARVNSLPSNIKLGAGSTLLVPAGQEGARDLSSIANIDALTQIIEREPVVTCSKKRCRASGAKVAKGKSGGAKVGVRSAGNTGKTARNAGAKSSKLAVTKGGAKTAKSASSKKPAGGAKVARASNGRRG